VGGGPAVPFRTAMCRLPNTRGVRRGVGPHAAWDVLADPPR
jgi:hypothetical protein